jgi:hypothetical protein
VLLVDDHAPVAFAQRRITEKNSKVKIRNHVKVFFESKRIAKSKLAIMLNTFCSPKIHQSKYNVPLLYSNDSNVSLTMKKSIAPIRPVLKYQFFSYLVAALYFCRKDKVVLVPD